jgi:hypothetical protein
MEAFMKHDVAFEILKGKTITGIKGLANGSDEVDFTTSTGEVFRLYHEQDCCESVSIVDFDGDYTDVLNREILSAEATRRDAASEEACESGTWTFYN